MSKEEVQYELTHPEYDACKDDYTKHWALYQGAAEIEKGNFLVQHPFEAAKQFDVRKKRATYKNYAAPIVDLFAMSVTDGIERSGLESEKGPVNDTVDALMKNCDQNGKKPDTFFKEAATYAAARGAHFIVVDVPEGSGAKTMADVKSNGLFPYFIHTPATNLICWGHGADGKLDFVVIKNEGKETTGPFKQFDDKKTITLWTRKEWKRYVKTGDGKYAPSGEGVHNLGEVPVIPVLYEPVSSMTGKSAIDDVASLILRVYNEDSELDKSLFDSCIPQMVATGVKGKEEQEMISSTDNIWCFSASDATVRYVEPSGSAYASKRQQLMDDINAIREISLRQVRPPSGVGESAESKRLDNVQISSQLAEFARRCAAVETQCWRLAMAWMKVSAPEFSIKYNEKFDPEAMGEKLSATFMELRKNGDLSRETLWERLMSKGVLPDNFDMQGEIARLENETKQGAGPNGEGVKDLAAGILGKIKAQAEAQ